MWPQPETVSGGATQALDKATAFSRDIGLEPEEFVPRGLARAHELWWLFFERLSAPLTQALIAGREDESHWSGTELMHRALREPPVSTHELLMAMATRDRMQAALLREMDSAGIDAILLPVCGTEAFPHRQREFQVGNEEQSIFSKPWPPSPRGISSECPGW